MKQFLGRVPIGRALEEQDRLLRGGGGTLLGFESEPVITLGVRARPSEDVFVTPAAASQLGISLLHVPRAGQATLHNPGQLVLFPVFNIREMGVRRWTCLLSKVTVGCLSDLGVQAHWDEQRPGIYTERGKIGAIGLKISEGVSTHGLALNVCNDLAQFGLIRPCGDSLMSPDRILDWGINLSVEDLWELWSSRFAREWSSGRGRRPSLEPIC